MTTKRAKNPSEGIAWMYERDIYHGYRIWCVNCEEALSIELDSDGQPYVTNHLDVNDCSFISRRNDMVNNFLMAPFRRSQ